MSGLVQASVQTNLSVGSQYDALSILHADTDASAAGF